MRVRINNYADFLKALEAVGPATSIMYLGSPDVTMGAAIIGDTKMIIGSFSAPRPTEADFLIEFPGAHKMTNTFDIT